jgi:hypothetical protein
MELDDVASNICYLTCPALQSGTPKGQGVLSTDEMGRTDVDRCSLEALGKVGPAGSCSPAHVVPRHDSSSVLQCSERLAEFAN